MMPAFIGIYLRAASRVHSTWTFAFASSRACNCESRGCVLTAARECQGAVLIDREFPCSRGWIRRQGTPARSPPRGRPKIFSSVRRRCSHRDLIGCTCGNTYS